MQDDMFSSVATKATKIPPKPASSSGDMFDDVAPAKTSAPVAQSGTPPAPPQPPGFFTRLGQSLGVPTSKAELDEMGKREQELPVWQRMLPHIPGSSPSAGKSIVNTLLGPGAPALDMIQGYGKNTVQGFKDARAESTQADKDLKAGLITPGQAQAIKSFASNKGLVNAVPFIGPAINTAGEDVTTGNYRGAAGGLTGVIGQVAAPELIKGGAKAAQVAKIKALPSAALTPAEQIAKTAPATKIATIHNAAKVALPEIQEAASGMGQPIQTVEHAIDATKQAKTNIALDAQSKLDAQGGGKTLADAPEEYHAKVKALDTLQDHLEDLSKQKDKAIESAAKASKNTPATRGAAAGVLAKGMAKSAVGGVLGEGIGAVLPGGGPVVRAGLDAVGLGMGGKDLAAGMRGLIKPSGVGVADALDNSVAGAFKPQVPTGLPQTPAGPDPFAAPVGPVDPRVQPQPPAFTRPDPGPVGKVTRPVPATPVPSEPYVSPRMARIKAGESPMVPTPQEASTPSGFPKATAEGFSSPNPPRSNLAKNQKDMAKWGIKLPEEQAAPPSGLKGSLDQFEKQYKGKYTESNGTVDPAGLLKKIGADDVIPRDKVAHIEKAWRAGEKVEPVKLYVDEDNNILGADGRHRAQAAVNAGVKKIPIIVRRVKSK